MHVHKQGTSFAMFAKVKVSLPSLHSGCMYLLLFLFLFHLKVCKLDKIIKFKPFEFLVM